MTKLALIVPVVGEKNSVADPKIPTALKEIEKVVNGELEGTNNFKAEGIKESNLEKALQEKIGAKVSGLTYVAKNESIEIKNGELIEQLKAGATVTLPKPTAGVTVGIFSATIGVKVKSTEGTISGDFINSLATIELTALQHVILQGNGSNWLITSGEPTREQRYVGRTERTSGVSYEITGTREVEVIISMITGLGLGSTVSGNLYINGGLFLQLEGRGAVQTTIRLHPADKWEIKEATFEKIWSYYRIL